jgi:hypothetical protein
MYITEVVRPYGNGKASRCILLRESYRKNGRVKNRTLANLSRLPPEAIEALKAVLRCPGNGAAGPAGGATTSAAAAGAPAASVPPPTVRIEQGLSIGAVATVYQVAQRLGIARVLGTSRQGKLALWQVIARVIQPGSCLAAVRLAREHAACDLLKLHSSLCEDDLYRNLAWLSDRQLALEKALLRQRRATAPALLELFLYDVTSSYLEGEHNALGAFGYCRDNKKGKQQVVVGLLTDAQGEPISVEVFQGNTQDVTTLTEQVRKLAHEFGCRRITLVGDRGMIKQLGIEKLQQADFYFISAITKAQIETLLQDDVLQLDLFDESLCEVTVPTPRADAVEQPPSATPAPRDLRYVLRRNPVRAQELAQSRQAKKAAVEQRLRERNAKLAASPRTQLAVARRTLVSYIAKLRLQSRLKVRKQRGQRQLYLVEDDAAKQAQSQLDGCYVIRTDLPTQAADSQTVHDRYRALAQVEQGFRTCKTVHLEMRPWFVTCEASTRGHALVVMLAYKIVRHLASCWRSFDMEVVEALAALKQITLDTVTLAGQPACQHVPTPRAELSRLLEAAEITLPTTLPHLGTRVVTRKNIAEARK